MSPSLVELGIGDEPSLWTELGFHVDQDRCRLGAVDVVLTGSDGQRGIHSWSWVGANSGIQVGDIPTTVVTDTSTDTSASTSTIGDGADAAEHPNGVIGLFYVVLFGPSWLDGAEAMESLGVSPGEGRPMGSGQPVMLRSLADGGGAQIEIIGPPDRDPERNWRLWGMIVEVADLDHTAARLGPALRPIKPAVQPGRRIATLDRSAGSSVAVAFISSPATEPGAEDATAMD